MADDGNTNHDLGIGLALLAIVIAVVLWLIWYFNADVISNTIRWFRYGQMWMVQWFISDDYMVPYEGSLLPWHDGFEAVPQIPYQKTPEALGLFTTLTINPMRWFYSVVLVSLGIWALYKGPGTQFKTKLDLEGLLKRQATNFPIIAPFVKFNPSKQPPRPPGTDVPAELPPFAEALGPEEWLAYNAIPLPDDKIDKDAAQKAFRKQLGPYWRGTKYLAPELQILLAAFCLRAARKRKDSDTLLGELALTWTYNRGLNNKSSKRLLKKARKIFKDESLSKSTLEVCDRHAFVTTALLGALKNARDEGGILAPAQFLWLRAHNRQLWYPLNNLGRQSFHMEALGAMSHFKAERMTQRPIPKPQLDDAVQTISEYMDSDKARPVPKLDYGKSKKSGIREAI